MDKMAGEQTNLPMKKMLKKAFGGEIGGFVERRLARLAVEKADAGEICYSNKWLLARMIGQSSGY